ncbi:MAG: hypothetical protein AAFZ17_03780 [Cyanobacteria bacterium J06650_10]
MSRYLRLQGRTASCLLLLALGLIALAVIYSIPLNYPPIRGDGMGYYLYLPTSLIFHDLTLQQLVAHFGQPLGEWTGAGLLEGTSHYIIKYPIGEALLLAPSFCFAMGVAWLVGAPVDGFSWPFQTMVALSGLTYGVVGFGILWKILSKDFKEKTIRICLWSLALSTNLFHYATYDASYTHIYSFFLFSLFLLIVQTVYNNSSSRLWAALGLVSGLIIVTRPTNIVWLVFGLLYGVYDDESFRQRILFWRREVWNGLWCLVALCFPVFLQMLYWKVVTGQFVYYSYTAEGFYFLNPNILKVLFSVQKGLFFWSPILLLTLPGLLFVRRFAVQYWLPALIFIPINTYIISSWSTWTYGGSFGQRPFLESLPVSAICLCSLYQGSPRQVRQFLNGLFILTSALSVWLMLHYWTNVIPFNEATIQDVLRTFGL